MTIHLSKDLEQIVDAAVRAGLYAREEDVIRDALTRLQQAMPNHARTTRKTAKRAKAASQKPKKPLTEAEFDQHLLSIGLMSQLPDTDADFDDPDDEPITIKGEPLSETVIRERR
jgi:Arc/MetJ-type ribon-helix-helix transcriptional regulator